MFRICTVSPTVLMANKRRRAGFDPSGTLEAGTSRRCALTRERGDNRHGIECRYRSNDRTQRIELKRLCDEAHVPDKSGELLTRTGAQQMIDELRHKAAEHRSK